MNSIVRPIVESHHRCGRVQDPYSFRCQPQVMGASLDLLVNAARTHQAKVRAMAGVRAKPKAAAKTKR